MSGYGDKGRWVQTNQKPSNQNSKQTTGTNPQVQGHYNQGFPDLNGSQANPSKVPQNTKDLTAQPSKGFEGQIRDSTNLGNSSNREGPATKTTDPETQQKEKLLGNSDPTKLEEAMREIKDLHEKYDTLVRERSGLLRDKEAAAKEKETSLRD